MEAHDSQEHELSLVILLWYNSASKSSNSEQAKLFCSDSGGSTVVFFTVLAEAGKFGCQAVVSQIYFLFVFQETDLLIFSKLICFDHQTQRARTDLNKRFLPKPMTTTG